MSINVQFNDQLNAVDAVLKKRLVQLCESTAAELSLPNCELSVSFVDEDEIRRLNHQYRGKNSVTDVLSFPMDDDLEHDEPEDDDERVLILGDVIICFPQARRQAEQYGHTLPREVAFLLVHGFLHLVGYDHDDEEAEQEMFARQEQILSLHQFFR